MLFGETFRFLRQDKGLTQTEAATKIMSVQQLSKFERNECGIGAEKMFKLLDRLNFFSFELDNFSVVTSLDQQLKFLNKLQLILEKNDLEELQLLVIEEKNKYSIDGNFRHQFNAIIVEQRINQYVGIPFEKNKIKKLTKYLLDANYWWGYEITLFKNMIFCLDDQTTELLYFRMLRQYRRRDCQDFVLVQLTDVLTEFILKAISTHRDMGGLLWKTEGILDIFTGRRCYSAKNKVLFLEGLCLILAGNKPKGTTLVDHAITVAVYMDDMEEKLFFKQTLEKYVT